MGLLERLGLGASRAAERQTLASRSFSFPDTQSAQAFQGAMAAGGIGNDPGAFSAWQTYSGGIGIAGDYGGQMIRSIGGRELRVYGYTQRIASQDRAYLFARDPTAAMFVEKPWQDMWNGFPRTFVPEIDAFFAEQVAFGLLTSFQGGYQEYYQEGGGLIVLEATGATTDRLSRGTRPLGWKFIPAHAVIDTAEGENGYLLAEGADLNDPLLDHGIQYLSVYANPMDRERGKPTRLHGSRFFPINLDPRAQGWWRTPNIPVNRIYDTLWELRDVIFSRIRAMFQADPIVVDVMLDADTTKIVNFAEQTQEQRNAMSKMVEQSIIDYNDGAKTSFAPVMAFKMRRLGAAQLPDAKEDVMMLSSRLAHGSVFPVKMVLASTKGSSDVTDQDLLIYQGNLQNLRNTWGYKHLAKVLLMGRIMGVNGLRMQDAHELPAPSDLEWPLIRPLSPRDAAFTEKTDIVIYREAQEAGLVPPPRLLRKFAQDARYPIPLWLAARGRNTLGENTDVDPMNEPGSAGSSSSTAAGNAEILDRLEAIQDRIDEQEATVLAPLLARSKPVSEAS